MDLFHFTLFLHLETLYCKQQADERYGLKWKLGKLYQYCRKIVLIYMLKENVYTLPFSFSVHLLMI